MKYEKFDIDELSKRMSSISYIIIDITGMLTDFINFKGLNDILSVGFTPSNKRQIKLLKKEIAERTLAYVEDEKELKKSMKSFNKTFITANKIATTKIEKDYIREINSLYKLALDKLTSLL